MGLYPKENTLIGDAVEPVIVFHVIRMLCLFSFCPLRPNGAQLISMNNGAWAPLVLSSPSLKPQDILCKELQCSPL